MVLYHRCWQETPDSQIKGSITAGGVSFTPASVSTCSQVRQWQMQRRASAAKHTVGMFHRMFTRPVSMGWALTTYTLGLCMRTSARELQRYWKTAFITSLQTSWNLLVCLTPWTGAGKEQCAISMNKAEMYEMLANGMGDQRKERGKSFLHLQEDAWYFGIPDEIEIQLWICQNLPIVGFIR